MASNVLPRTDSLPQLALSIRAANPTGTLKNKITFSRGSREKRIKTIQKTIIDPIKVEAATRIQARYRGWSVRRKIVLARLTPLLLQSDLIKKFAGANDLLHSAMSICRLICKFTLGNSETYSGKSGRVELAKDTGKDDAKGPSDTDRKTNGGFCLVQRPGDWKSVTVTLINRERLSGEGSFKRIYQAVKYSLFPQTSLRHVPLFHSISIEKTNEFLKLVRHCDYVYGIEKEDENQAVIHDRFMKGWDVHKQLMEILGPGLPGCCPPLPEEILPPVNGKSGPSGLMEFLQPWFNSNLHDASRHYKVPRNMIGTEYDKFTIMDKLQMSAEIARILQYYHRNRFIHGDLKGSNIALMIKGQRSFKSFPIDFDFSGPPRQDYAVKTVYPYWDDCAQNNLMLHPCDIYAFVMMFAKQVIRGFKEPASAAYFNKQAATETAIQTLIDCILTVHSLPPSSNFASCKTGDSFTTNMSQHIRLHVSDKNEAVAMIICLQESWIMAETALNLLERAAQGSQLLYAYVLRNSFEDLVKELQHPEKYPEKMKRLADIFGMSPTRLLARFEELDLFACSTNDSKQLYQYLLQLTFYELSIQLTHPKEHPSEMEKLHKIFGLSPQQLLQLFVKLPNSLRSINSHEYVLQHSFENLLTRLQDPETFVGTMAELDQVFGLSLGELLECFEDLNRKLLQLRYSERDSKN